jgi:MerR family transcriptional regulator, copper efflux regulator
LFITRARNLGLSIDQIAEMLGIWDGNSCATTRQHLAAVIDTNLGELSQRIADLQAFAADLRNARESLDHGPTVCEPGLACCTPDINTETSVTVSIGRRP